jgi:thiol-disulfide isomerase/thioredoxin
MFKFVLALLIWNLLSNFGVASPRFIFNTSPGNTHNSNSYARDTLKVAFYYDGNELYIEDLRGNALILHFWATWCPECRNEIKALDSLAEQLNLQGIENVIILPVSLDFKDPEMIQQYYNEHGIKNLKISVDSKWSLFKELGLVSVPASVIIDKNGKEYARYTKNIKWDLCSIQDLLETLIDQ